jgi:hypothetical protein
MGLDSDCSLLGATDFGHDSHDVFHARTELVSSLLSWSAVDDGHVPLVVALAGRRREVVQPFDQLDAVGGGVLLHTRDPLGSGDRRDVVSRSSASGSGVQREYSVCSAGGR